MPEADRIKYVEVCGEIGDIRTETDKVYIAKCLDYLYKNSDNLGRCDDKEVMSVTIYYNNDTAYTINIKDNLNDMNL